MRTLTAILCLIFAVLLFSAGEGFALPPCPEDSNQRFHNCFGTYTYADGGKYVGEWRNGKRHGHGTYTYGTSSQWAGDKYVGEWRDGNFNGQSTYIYADVGKFIGEFRDGKRTQAGSASAALNK